MPFQSKNILMSSLVATSFVAIFCIINFYKLKKENEDLNKLLQEEKKIYRVQLHELEDSIKHSHSIPLQTNKTSNELNVTDTDIEKEILVHNEISIEALEIQNKKIDKEINKLTAIIEKNDKLILDLKNTVKSEEKVVDKIKALNVNARGVKVMSDFYKKTKVNKIQEIRVCFTLEANEFIKPGNKNIYIQVLNPNNQIISPHTLKDSLGSEKYLEYSTYVNANYNQKDTDACIYVDLDRKTPIKGVYKVKLFHAFEEIGNTSYEYQ